MLQRKRKNNKCLTSTLDSTIPHINLDDISTYSGTDTLFQTKIVNIRKNTYHNRYNSTSDSSESDFSLVQLKKRREYRNKKHSVNNYTNIKAHSTNNNYKKLGNKIKRFKDNSIEIKVGKHSTRTFISTLLKKVYDSFIDTDKPIDPSDYFSYSTKYSSSSEWKITSESDSLFIKQKRGRILKTTKTTRKKHNIIKK